MSDQGKSRQKQLRNADASLFSPNQPWEAVSSSVVTGQTGSREPHMASLLMLAEERSTTPVLSLITAMAR